MVKKQIVRMTLRESITDDRIARKVVTILSKRNGEKYSKNKAYIKSMQILALQLGL